MSHHNPMDPRDPTNAAFYFTFIDRGGSPRGGGTPNGGCGCMLLLVIVLAVILVIAVSASLTQ